MSSRYIPIPDGRAVCLACIGNDHAHCLGDCDCQRRSHAVDYAIVEQREPVAPGTLDPDEVEAALYDAIGHLEAAVSKLQDADGFALPPVSTAAREHLDTLVDVLAGVRDLHDSLAPVKALQERIDELEAQLAERRS